MAFAILKGDAIVLWVIPPKRRVILRLLTGGQYRRPATLNADDDRDL